MDISHVSRYLKCKRGNGCVGLVVGGGVDGVTISHGEVSCTTRTKHSGFLLQHMKDSSINMGKKVLDLILGQDEIFDLS